MEMVLRDPLATNVYAPVATAKVRRVSEPKYSSQNNNNGDITITHREYIVDIAGSVTFTSLQASINPGLSGVFPWLSGVAQRYESYRFDSLKFCFETEAPTSATGTVLLVSDYDASDSAPENKTQAMAYRSSVRSPPWSDCCSQALREDLSKRSSYYVRNGALAANQDVKLYDTGNLFVCTQGQANTNTIGELYVEYRIRLMTPQLGPAGVGEAVYGSFHGTSNAAPFGSVALTGNMPVGYSSSGTTTSVTTFTFLQPWQGYVTVVLVGTGLSGITPSGTSTFTEISDVVDSGAFNRIANYTLAANIGDTAILTLADTTISSGSVYFGQADV